MDGQHEGCRRDAEKRWICGCAFHSGLYQRREPAGEGHAVRGRRCHRQHGMDQCDVEEMDRGAAGESRGVPPPDTGLAVCHGRGAAGAGRRAGRGRHSGACTAVCRGIRGLLRRRGAGCVHRGDLRGRLRGHGPAAGGESTHRAAGRAEKIGGAERRKIRRDQRPAGEVQYGRIWVEWAKDL